MKLMLDDADMDQLEVADNELKRFLEADRGGGHGEGLGATPFEGYVFDWLDDTLGRSA